MEMQINIRNIKINSISTLGSLNVGKILFAGNRASSKQSSKPDYEENDLDVEKVLKAVPKIPKVIKSFPPI
ncbi:hypothetical protein BTR25_06080 [Bacillus sp. MRMR6]|nr:hypothetical protein BTR25_06080 [Bacillus sp. MRMR6]